MHRKDTNDRQQGQLETMWEKLTSKVDWEQPTQITDHVLLRCTQCGSESEPNKMTVDKEVRTTQQIGFIQYKYDYEFQQ